MLGLVPYKHFQEDKLWGLLDWLDQEKEALEQTSKGAKSLWQDGLINFHYLKERRKYSKKKNLSQKHFPFYFAALF